MKKLVLIFISTLSVLSMFLLGCSSISSVPPEKANQKLNELSPQQPNPIDTPDQAHNQKINEQMAAIQERPVDPTQ